MLFKNIKSGNLISATDETTIDLMRRSDNYVEICTKAPAFVSPQDPLKKAGKKSAEKGKADTRE